MTLNLKLRKSAGVRVSPAVHRRLTTANRARDARAWQEAANGYDAALQLDPTLTHIWIQLGHALKEVGDFVGAERAYRQALALRPDLADAHLHLGHVRKLEGDAAAAGRFYVAAARLEPRSADAMGEVYQMLARGSGVASEALHSLLAQSDAQSALEPVADEGFARPDRPLDDLIEMLKRQTAEIGGDAAGKLNAAMALLQEVASGAAGAQPQTPSAQTPNAQTPDALTRGARSPLVFDVSDLITYFRGGRLPTGIQRVQIEIIGQALQSEAGAEIRTCCIVEARAAWMEIPTPLFLLLCRLAVASGDPGEPEWLRALSKLHIHLSTATPLQFPAGGVLVNLGTSWWIPNYFLHLRQARDVNGDPIRYAPLIHDFIPLLAPQYCAKGLVEDFVAWIIGVFEHADFFFVDSEAIKRDLLQVAADLGRSVPPERVSVNHLDADFRKTGGAAPTRDILGRAGLARSPFVLLVSTLEIRKNHVLAFEAWLALMRRFGPEKTPKLVCVGRRGWLDETIFAKLRSHPDLAERVVILSDLSDTELSLLYEQCLFTLYPSTFEGWGLPVTESLCYGKVPLVSDGSSLPEAGGPFAVYFEADSQTRLVAALERLIFDEAYRRECEAKIAEGFTPRTWKAVAAKLSADILASGATTPTLRLAGVPMAQLGAHHALHRSRYTRIWPQMRSAEIFRSNLGWWGQDDFGCWTKTQGGALAFHLPDGCGPARIYLQLHGLPTLDTRFEVECGGRVVLDGAVASRQIRWVALELPAQPDGAPHSLLLRGTVCEDLAETTQGRDQRGVCLGLGGFYVCEANDGTARMAFLEALTLDTLNALAFSRQA